MTVATKKKSTSNPNTGAAQPFQAEVAKLLQLMVHSVYSERDVFMRELISNGSDALDKLRYEAIASPAYLDNDPELKITIALDSEHQRLTVSDNGIGMNAAELGDNLGTIARSGTQKFMADAKAAPDLIGQFGVGFYAAFMVADRVDVISRKAGEAQAHQWSSDGLGSYIIEEAAPHPRGTSVILHLKKDAAEFLQGWKIESVVKAYSDHIAHPIMMRSEGEEIRQINSASAIWTRAKNEVTADQHKEFFGALFHDTEDPALTIHYRAEGKQEYSVLLYVPKERPFDLYDPERRGRQKLYVRRVFIADDAALLPPYLRFVRGVIDSADMPLNLSREMLQNNPDVAAIRKAVTNRVLSELKKSAEKDSANFGAIWAAFGNVIKEGLYEDMERRDQLFEIARFTSTRGEHVSLKDYVAGLKENQTAIYYLTAEDLDKAKASPQLEGYRARDIEVLLLTDPVDSFWVRTAPGFDGKPFTSISQGAGDLDKIRPATEKPEPEVADDATLALIAALKKILADRVSAVRVSKRLTESAVCLVNDGHMDRTLEKLLSRQKDSGVSVSLPALEINAGHSLIAALSSQLAKNGEAAIDDAAHLLLEQAHIMEGEVVRDASGFARRMAQVLAKSLA
jgi:molecular chaperone HtpG